MDGIQAFAIGWDLDHPDLHTTTFADAPKLNRADVVFLAARAMEQFWRHAVGEDMPLFRSSVREREAWEDLLRRVAELKQMIRRGGLLVCRLDLPRRMCDVRCPSSRTGFAKVSVMDCYQALGGVHKGLKLLAQNRLGIVPCDLEPGSPTHPFAAYLGHFFWELAPAVALAEAPKDAMVLAQTTTGEPVSFALPGCVVLPKLALEEPRREARVLLRAAYAALERPLPESFFETDSSHLSRTFPLPGLDKLLSREQQLTQSISALQSERLEVCRQRDELESLWALVHPTGRDQLRRAVVVALEMLGFLVRSEAARDSGSLLIHSPEVDASGAVFLAGDAPKKGEEPLRWPGAEGGSATKFYLFLGCDNPGTNPLEVPLVAEVIRHGGCVVPAAELLCAVQTALGSPGLAKQSLRLSLAERTGVYQLTDDRGGGVS